MFAWIVLWVVAALAWRHARCFPVSPRIMPAGRFGRVVAYRGIDGRAYVRKIDLDKHQARRERRGMRLVAAMPGHEAVGAVHCVRHVVMRRAPGHDMLTFLQNGRANVEVVHAWGCALWSALAHLHRHQCVHGDVKPENVVVCGYALVLIDFGGVGRCGERRSVVGTALYLPAEPVFRLWPDLDVWAASVTLLVAWTGCPPLLAPGREVAWCTTDPHAAVEAMRRRYFTASHGALEHALVQLLTQRPGTAAEANNVWQVRI